MVELDGGKKIKYENGGVLIKTGVGVGVGVGVGEGVQISFVQIQYVG